MYTFRSLQRSDYEVLCTFPQNEEELYFMFPKAVFPLTPEQIEEAVKSRLEPTIIVCGHEVVAYANFYDHDGVSCWMGNVIVCSTYRGKGASQYLIQTMETIAKQKLKVKKIKLICHNTNTRGILFYKKQGFIPFDISSRRTPSGKYIAGIHMEKTI